MSQQPPLFFLTMQFYYDRLVFPNENQKKKNTTTNKNN